MKSNLEKMLKSERSCLSVQETKAYLNNNLSEQDRYGIEHHIQDCDLCEAALEGYASSNVEPTIPNVQDIHKKISPVETPEISEQLATIKPLRSKTNWLVAASILILCVAAAYIFSNRNDDLYAKFHVPYNSTVLASRAATASGNEAFEKGIIAFESEDFDTSLSLFKTAKLNEPENSSIALYAGLSALETGAFDQSIEWLTEARINQPISYATATWYLAMAHLAKEDFSSARTILLQLSPEDEPYYERAQVLITELRRH